MRCQLSPPPYIHILGVYFNAVPVPESLGSVCIYLSVCLSFCLSVCLSVCLSGMRLCLRIRASYSGPWSLVPALVHGPCNIFILI